MKISPPIFLFSFALMCLTSCDKKDDINYEYINVATPELMSKAEYRNSIEILGPESVESVGKIYTYNNLIFVSDTSKGIHIIDNINPENPLARAFIKIPGNVDISIKNNFLYADSSIDLLVIDISDINNIQMVSRVDDVFEDNYYDFPEDVQDIDFSEYDSATQVIIGWTVALERREIINYEDVVFSESAVADVGIGGSLARFQIVNNYLYTVGDYQMSIFNIQDLEHPVLENTQYAGWNVETMFEADNYLYLGSTNGMYIYNLSNPALPEYVSEITHWEGCDPVVVDGDYAYLTIRGGNICGQQESELQVIDVSDKFNPTLVGVYGLSNPYGLGFKGDDLFVCDGDSGLKIFNKSNPLDLKLNNHLDDVFGKDVIPLEHTLIMVSDNKLYQYEYVLDSVNLISSYSL